MGINDQLLKGIKNHLYDYGCDYYDISKFLHSQNGFDALQAKALDIIEKAMTANQKKPLAATIAQLALVEQAIKPLQPH